MSYRLIWIFVLSIAFSAPVYPELFDQETEDLEEFYGDEEWIAISTGTKKPVYKAPAVANVITEEDIKRIGATTLDEILESVPGLHVGFSPARLESMYIIRGIGNKFANSQVLTLVNGISIDTTLNGGRPNAFHMPVANIERIEIIRGPGSAVYGADAYAGVINIITKNAESSKGTRAGLRFGDHDTQEFWLTHGGKMGDWDVYFGLDSQSTDGDDGRIISSDLQSQLDTLFGTTASLAPGALDTEYNVTDTRLTLSKEHWLFSLSNLDIADVGQAAGAAQALDHTGKVNSRLFTTDITYHNEEVKPNWDLKVIFSYKNMKGEPDFQLLPSGTVVPIGADGNLFTAPSGNCPLIGGAPLCIVNFTDGILGNPYMSEDHVYIEAVSIYNGIENHRIRTSIGYENREVEASATQNFGPGVIDGTTPIVDGTLTDVTGTPNIYLADGKQSRSVTFISIQDEWEISNDWELTAGLRYDDYSDFGDTINPRLALVWLTNYNLTTKFLYGKAFRAPSFNDQFLQNNPVALGNADVGPETIDTFEIAFDYRHTLDSQIIFNMFTYDAKDLILYVRDNTGASVTQNTRGQKGHGLEIEGHYKINKEFDLYGNFSWLKTKDKITSDEVADVPTRQLYLRASWDIKRSWILSSQVNWVAGRHRLRRDPNNISLVADTRDEIDDYVTVDFTLRKKELYKSVNFAASIRNAFDEDARDPSAAPNVAIPDDFPLPGRNYFIEASIDF